MPDRSIEVRGLDETRQKVDQVVADLHGPALLNGMRKATAIVAADAKRLSPVDVGRLRTSIMPDLRQQGRTTLGIVGTNVDYAAAVELGSKAHWAPSAPLKLWARRKGATQFLLSMGDKPYVWLKAKKGVFFMRRALKNNEARIRTILGDVVTEIVNK